VVGVIFLIKFKMQNMKSTKFLVSLVALIALVLSLNFVAAFGSVTSVEVNDREVFSTGSSTLSVIAGDVLEVTVTFEATDNASNVRVKADLAGARATSDSSEPFFVESGKRYVKKLYVEMPFDLDEKISDKVELEIEVESDDTTADDVKIELSLDREFHLVQILDVVSPAKVTSGDNLVLDIVIKNRGAELAEDNFVIVRIPSLGISDRAYFGDLSAIDQSNPDKEDAVERRVYLKIPAETLAGVYSLEVEAFNDDSSTIVTKKVAIVGASDNTIVASSVKSRTVKTGENGQFTVTIVNSGNKVRVYEIVPEAASGLFVQVSEPIVAVPAGTSKTVIVAASSDAPGKNTFGVNVQSNSEVVKRESFTLNVEDSKGFTSSGGNATVLLTIILVIVFVVLLIVLIVLLTRKPEQKSDEFGESYY
jgi:hypothetical protein